jgi:hypothetical protein
MQQSVETHVYNNFGQRVRFTDAEGNVTCWEYYPARDPDGDGAIDNPAGDPDTGGYLRRVIWDADLGPDRNSDQNPTPVQKTITYEYTAQGDFPANPRGVPTAIIDPRGIKHTFLVNERDQIVTHVRAADVSGSPEPGLEAFRYEPITLYDANDNVVEERIENTDTLDGDADFIVHRFDYDILDQRTREIWDIGPGRLNIENRFEYDPSQNRTKEIRGFGQPEESTRWRSTTSATSPWPRRAEWARRRHRRPARGSMRQGTSSGWPTQTATCRRSCGTATTV